MIIKVKSHELASKAAHLIKKSIDKIEKDYVVLGVPGGRSAAEIFEALKKEDISWDKVHVFMVDERLVPEDHEDSNFRLVKEHLAEALPEENVHPYNENYEQELKKYGGAYDIILLSSGEDGHFCMGAAPD